MEFVHPLTSKPIQIKKMTLADISHERMDQFQIIKQTGGSEKKTQ